MKLKKIIVICLLCFSPYVFADTPWVVVGGNMFDHPNADSYSSICVTGANHEFTKTNNLEKVENRDYPKYTILSLKNIAYSYKVGYMGKCQSSYQKTHEIIYNEDHPTIIRAKKIFHEARAKNDAIIKGSERDKIRAKEFFNNNFKESYSLSKTVWQLPHGDTLVQECIQSSFSSGADRMYGDGYSIALVSKNGESNFLKQYDISAKFDCNCDLDGVTSCRNISSVMDYDNNGVLELIYFEEHSCGDLWVDEIVNNKLVRAFNRSACVNW